MKPYLIFFILITCATSFRRPIKHRLGLRSPKLIPKSLGRQPETASGSSNSFEERVLIELKAIQSKIDQIEKDVKNSLLLGNRIAKDQEIQLKNLKRQAKELEKLREGNMFWNGLGLMFCWPFLMVTLPIIVPVALIVGALG